MVRRLGGASPQQQQCQRQSHHVFETYLMVVFLRAGPLDLVRVWQDPPPISDVRYQQPKMRPTAPRDRAFVSHKSKHPNIQTNDESLRPRVNMLPRRIFRRKSTVPRSGETFLGMDFGGKQNARVLSSSKCVEAGQR